MVNGNGKAVGGGPPQSTPVHPRPANFPGRLLRFPRVAIDENIK